jgi:hypothetical protein
MNAPEPSIRDYPARTLADYQAKLIDIFGSMPSPQRLARLENRAMLAASGHSGQRYVAPAADTRKAALDNPNCAEILRALHYPMTRREVCQSTGMNGATAKAAFHRLANAGLIKRHSMNRQHVTVWERGE